MSAAWLTIGGVVQSYDWGKIGADSLVAKLTGRSLEAGRFAELWFGDHQKGPAPIAGNSGRNLTDAISSEPTKWLGDRQVDGALPHLPFLFKVLSIDRSAGLSLQVHPRRADVEKIFHEKPTLLSDRGEKFEMGIARTTVRLFIGIRPVDELNRLIRSTKAYAAFIAKLNIQGRSLVPQDIQNLSRVLLEAEDRDGAELVGRIAQEILSSEPRELGDCFDRLRKNYGDSDAGLRIIPLLNFVTLSPGQGIFIEPGTIHAYLEGDLVECMVSSDNVLRAGLTRKEIQKSIVVDSTAWQPYLPQVAPVAPSPLGSFLYRYGSTADQSRFIVDVCEDRSGSVQLIDNGLPSMVVVIDGKVVLTGNDGACAEVTSGRGALLSARHGGVSMAFEDATAYLVTMPAEY